MTNKEKHAQEIFLRNLNHTERKTEKPLVVAMIGLVGSGKSTVARELAREIGATVVCSDDIRILLRKQGAGYARVRDIAINVADEVLKSGGNVVLDSDFADKAKRDTIRTHARTVGHRLILIRVHADLDILIGRMLSAKSTDRTQDLFAGAYSNWAGEKKFIGTVVKIREALRRIPLHYRWSKESGGKWILRRFQSAVFATIDTGKDKNWKKEVVQCAKRLR